MKIRILKFAERFVFLEIPTVQHIINSHYEQNYRYYRKICRQKYNGNYLYEDLLHELYFNFLRVRPEKILEYNSTNSLNVIGNRLIKWLYIKRTRHNQNNNKNKLSGDSPLFETATKSFIEMDEDGEPRDPLDNIGVEDECFEDADERQIKERRLDTLNSLITANRNNDKIQLLLMCENQTIVDVANQMGTTKYMVRRELNTIKQTLKEHIL